MRVLITRPEPDASDLARELARGGHEVVSAPLMHVAWTTDPPPPDLAQLVPVFTSANGVRAFVARHAPVGERAYAVGEATAAQARDAGFREVVAAGGDVQRLAETLLQEAERSPRRLLHVRGTHVAGNLAMRLQRAGIPIAAWRAYQALPVSVLPEAARRFLQGGAGWALFYSPRTAALFADLVREADLSEAVSRHCAAALSPVVAERLSVLNWRQIKVAAHPSSQDLLACLEGPCR